MILQCALAVCSLPQIKQSSLAAQELSARRMLNVSVGFYGNPSKGPFGALTFTRRVDSAVGITEYDFGNASAYFDTSSGRFQFLVNLYARPTDKKAIAEEECLGLVMRAYRSLYTGFDLKDVKSISEPVKNALRFTGHQYFKGTRIEDAGFSARVSVLDGCLEIFNVGKLVDPPSRAMPQPRPENEVVYASAVEVASKTGEQELELRDRPELVISNRSVLSNGSIFKLRGNVLNLSVLANSAPNGASSFYSIVSSFRPKDQSATYQVRLDARTLKLVSIVDYGVGNTGSKVANTVPSNALCNWDEVLVGRKKAAAEGGYLTIETKPKSWHESIPVLLRSRDSLLLVSFDKRTNYIRFRVGKEDKFAVPNSTLLKALRIVSTKPSY